MMVADKATGQLIGQTLTVTPDDKLQPGEIKIHTGHGTRVVHQDDVKLVPFS